MISVRPRLTDLDILSRTTEYEIYARYFKPFKYGMKYSSPFRYDPVPSFVIKQGPSGHLFHKDFGSSNSGNCFKFVMQLFNISYSDCLEKINNELGLNNQSIKILSNPSIVQRADLKIIPRNFIETEIEYWYRLGINKEDLKLENIYSIDKLYINGNLKFSNELRFAYLFIDEDKKEYLKIYTPYAVDKSNKFKTNVPSTLISGWDKVKNGGKTAIITKSKKDEVISTKILPTSCSLQSENTKNLTEEKIKFFKENFDEVFILFDPDETGIDAAMYYNQQYGLKNIVIPYRMYLDGIKDLADLSYNYGIGAVVQFFKSNNII